MPSGIYQRKKGRKLSDEHKRKISESNKGKHFYWLGKKNPEHSKTMKVIARERGFGKWMKGKKLYKEWRDKVVQNGKKTWFRFGEQHLNWKGGITPLRIRLYYHPKHKEWRKKILERDNYTCQVCGKKGGRLEVDHYPIGFAEILNNNNIKSFEKAIECKHFWDINNGRVLCSGCHKKTSNYGFRSQYSKIGRK